MAPESTPPSSPPPLLLELLLLEPPSSPPPELLLEAPLLELLELLAPLLLEPLELLAPELEELPPGPPSSVDAGVELPHPTNANVNATRPETRTAFICIPSICTDPTLTRRYHRALRAVKRSPRRPGEHPPRGGTARPGRVLQAVETARARRRRNAPSDVSAAAAWGHSRASRHRWAQWGTALTHSRSGRFADCRLRAGGYDKAHTPTEAT